jgi:energy-coupling factor transporter ATP-binding protein EcfA2
MGPVGAGKSTLCFALNGAVPQAVDGDLQGQVIVLGQDTAHTSMGQLAMQVGLLFEDVEAQLFSATVADEVAFGLEAMGLPATEIEQRIDESLALVDLVGLRHRSPRTLSGGEQKRLALASVLAMRPEVLVLDEPTLGLDPKARGNLLHTINRLRVERGPDMTVVMATQDAEAAARFADRVVVLREGTMAQVGTPAEIFSDSEQASEWGIRTPQLAALASVLCDRGEHRLTSFSPDEAYPTLAEAIDGRPLPLARATRTAARSSRPDPLFELRELCYRYPNVEESALRGVDLDIGRGEWLAVIGINGSGKSTLIRHLNGLLKPTSGTVYLEGQDIRPLQVGELAKKVSYLPQNPDHLIFTSTVREEIAYGPKQLGLKGEALDERVTETLSVLDLLPYADHPPAVLGYGLRRQVALASVLAMQAPVLVLDEPTVGLDFGLATRLMSLVAARHREGTTVVMITHDLQWVARHADWVAVLHGGRVCSQGPPTEVLADVEQLLSVGLAPLPATELAHMLGWPSPLPLTAEELVAGISMDGVRPRE